MATHRVLTTDVEIEAAIAEASARPPEPKAIQAKYLPDYRLLLVKMDTGEAHSFFAPKMQGLQNLTHAQIARVKITGLGSALTWEDQDLDLHVPSLIAGVFGTKEWMAALRKKGGASRSLSNIKAARENGAKGGRPRTTRVSH